MKRYKVFVPFQHDMGSIAPFIATECASESARENALWHINSMRQHDGLKERASLPAHVRFELINPEAGAA